MQCKEGKLRPMGVDLKVHDLRLKRSLTPQCAKIAPR